MVNIAKVCGDGLGSDTNEGTSGRTYLAGKNCLAYRLRALKNWTLPGFEASRRR